MQSTDNIRSELHKNVTVRKRKKKSYAEIVKGCSSRNNKGLNFSEKLVSTELVSTEDISKSSIYEMKINNGVGEMGLSEYHGKVSEGHRSTDLEKCCDKNMSEPLSFNEQEPKIGNKECEEITSEEGKDTVITGLFRENFVQDLTRSDKDFLDILVDLGKENSVLKVDINEGLNGSNVGDKFPKVVPPETDQNKTAVFNDSSMSEKNQRLKVPSQKMVV